MTGRAGEGSDTDRIAELTAERDELLSELAAVEIKLGQALEDVVTWRTSALEGWDEAAGSGGSGFAGDEAAAMRATLSWRVTRPLRLVRGRMGPPALRG